MFNVRVSNPQGSVLQTTTDCVVCKTINGEVSFYPDHVPYLSTIDNGYAKINDQVIEIKNGSILLDESNNVTILIDE